MRAAATVLGRGSARALLAVLQTLRKRVPQPDARSSPLRGSVWLRVDVQLVGDKSNTRVEQRTLHLDAAAAAVKFVQKGSVRVFLRFDAINQARLRAHGRGPPRRRPPLVGPALAPAKGSNSSACNEERPAAARAAARGAANGGRTVIIDTVQRDADRSRVRPADRF
jgi:hypothetical protein